VEFIDKQAENLMLTFACIIYLFLYRYTKVMTVMTVITVNIKKNKKLVFCLVLFGELF